MKNIFLMLMILSCAKHPKSYILSLSSNPPEAGTAKGGGVYNLGSSVTITADTKLNSGYTFTNWIDVSNGKVITTDKIYTFSIYSNKILSARFARSAAD